MATVHPEEAQLTAEDTAVLPQTFTIDAVQWEAYDKAAAAMHVASGCPYIAQTCCCVPNLFVGHIVCGAPCIFASVMERIICCYEEQPLPEFEHEALVVTATGVSGYRRPENRGCHSGTVKGAVIPMDFWDVESWWCGCYVPQYYVRGSSWEPATLTWENVHAIHIVKNNHDPQQPCCCSPSDGSSGCPCQGARVDSIWEYQGDPLLRPCGLNFGICCPCLWVPCCESNLPDYTGLRIESTKRIEGCCLGGPTGYRPEVTLQVIALKEDPDHVLKVLNAAWAASQAASREEGQAAQVMLEERLAGMDMAACRMEMEKEDLTDGQAELIQQRIAQLEAAWHTNGNKLDPIPHGQYS
jgi:hypothetical protein